MISSLNIANTFAIKGIRNGVSVTPMKLQKLIYLLYANYIAKTNRPLFSDRFEAWEHGPVIRTVYNEFKRFGRKTIDTPFISGDGQAYYAVEQDDVGRCVGEVWGKYSHFTGPRLSAVTHEDGTAWSKKNLGDFLDDADIKTDGQRWFGGGLGDPSRQG